MAVALGTDHHRFDRLLQWVSELADDQPTLRWFVQHGATPLPQGLDGEKLMSVDALTALFAECDAVICHAGPGLIMDARAAGHIAVVVPRRPEKAEIVDGHQLRFAEYLAAQGAVRLADDQDAFEAAVLGALSAGRSAVSASNSTQSTVQRFGDLVSELVISRSGPKRRWSH